MKEVMIKSFKSANLKMDDGLLLEVEVVKDDLLKAIVTKINADIVEKIDQEVELISIDLTSINSFTIEGRAKAMGISKEFTLFAYIAIDKEKDLISLKVKDIEVKGGFLVKKGFELVENKIKEKIESSAKIELTKTLKSLSPSIGIPGSDQKMNLSIKEFDLSTLELIPNGKDLNVRVEIVKVDVLVNKENENDS